MDTFIKNIKNAYKNFRIENDSFLNSIYFSYNDRNFCIYYNNVNRYMVEENAEGGYVYSVDAIWDDNLNYHGTTNNCLLPKDLDLNCISLKEFEKYIS
jgi:hypothetical protein